MARNETAPFRVGPASAANRRSGVSISPNCPRSFHYSPLAERAEGCEESRMKFIPALLAIAAITLFLPACASSKKQDASCCSASGKCDTGGKKHR